MDKLFSLNTFVTIVNSILAPFVLMSLWNWFVFPITNFYIGYLHSMGIALFVGFFLVSLRFQISELYKHITDDNYVYTSSASLLVAYLSGAIINYFMVI